MRRKILFAIGSRANYASIKSVMIEVQSRKDLELQIVCFSSSVLSRFGKVSNQMRLDGLEPDIEIETLIEGETLQSMAESTGLALLRLPKAFIDLAPDVVLTVGDRYETIATAVAAAYLNIPLAHTMGGEITGSIDESIRHAITKFAHIHFPATQLAAERLKLMGESSQSIYLAGCPRIDIARKVQDTGHDGLENLCVDFGVGGEIDFKSPFVLVSQHPVTTEYETAESQMAETLEAVRELNLPAIVLWPNSDAGSAAMSQQIRKWREKDLTGGMHFFKNLPVERYLQLMNLTSCLIGNSSSGLREGAFLGTPVVNLGTRQIGREHTSNVTEASHTKEEILQAATRQIAHGKYHSSLLYGDGFAGARIAKILAEFDSIEIQKKLSY
jgi:UDP-hydrolysing UDP-N-acetyl-D-glucosamine 2-epimerase